MIQAQVSSVNHGIHAITLKSAEFSCHNDRFIFFDYHASKYDSIDLKTNSIINSYAAPRHYANFDFIIFTKSHDHADQTLTIFNHVSQQCVCDITLHTPFFIQNFHTSSPCVTLQGDYYILVSRRDFDVCLLWLHAHNFLVAKLEFINVKSCVESRSEQYNCVLLPQVGEFTNVVTLCLPINEQAFTPTSAYCTGFQFLTIKNGEISKCETVMLSEKLYTHAKWCYLITTRR